jgi:hypothetical protein
MSERVTARRRLRALLGTDEDVEMAQALARFRTELGNLIADPGATRLSKRGLTALDVLGDRASVLRRRIAKVEPRVSEADRLLKALEGYHRGLHDMRIALQQPLTTERAARVERAAHVIERSGDKVQRAWEDLSA